MEQLTRCRGQFGDSYTGSEQRASQPFPAKLVISNMDKGQIGYPDKTEKRSQIGIKMIELSETATAFVAGVTGGDNNKNPLAMHERFIGLLLISRIEIKCTSDADDLVEVGLERRRNAKVIHRQTNNKNVSGQQFVDQRITDLQRVPHRRGSLVSRCKSSRDDAGELQPCF